MKDIKSFGFKNLKKLNIIKPPKCECCGYDEAIILDEDQLSIGDYGMDILSDYDIGNAAALIMRKNATSYGLMPLRVFDKTDSEHMTFFEFGNTDCEDEDMTYEDAVIGAFTSMVNENDLNTVLLLEQDETDSCVYNVIY